MWTIYRYIRQSNTTGGIKNMSKLNRAQRRAMKSKKGSQYRVLKRPTDNGNFNGKRKTGKAGF